MPDKDTKADAASPVEPRELAGQTAIVTGASGGIGRATAIALARAGANVVVHYRSSSLSAETVVADCKALGVESIAVHAELTNPHEVQRLVSEAARLGAVRILVNNAGWTQHKLFIDTTLSDWEAVLGSNLTSVFLVTKEVLPLMLQAGYGRIIQVSSVWGLSGGACESAYSAAKGGVIALTKALAQEVARSGITVNAVAPGAIDTAMVSEFDEAEIASLADDIPMGRLGSPDEVASVILFLASKASSYITGQVVSPNGGWRT